MSAATQGCEEIGVESRARDGSDSPIIITDSVSEKSVKVHMESLMICASKERQV